jgi:tRNA A37 threonylcarbamoyladenosine modification protein TsaB
MNANLNKNYLFIDAATPVIQVGIWQKKNWQVLLTSTEEALTAIFKLVDETLRVAGNLKIQDLSGIGFCNGPGSLLSLRLALAAIRTWSQIYKATHGSELPVVAYTSLNLGARFVLKQKPKLPFCILAPGRNRTWYTLTVETEQTHTLCHTDHLLETRSYYVIPQRKYSLPLPNHYKLLHYDLKKEVDFFNDFSFLSNSSPLELFMPSIETYRKVSSVGETVFYS